MKEKLISLTPLILVLAVSIYSVFPSIINFNNSLIYLGDDVLITWILNQNIQKIPYDLGNLFQGNIFYPLKNTIIYSVVLLPSSIIGYLPMKLTGSFASAFNAAHIFGQVASMLVVYFWFKEMFKDKWAAAIGSIALSSCTTGEDNVGVGVRALVDLTEGSANTAIGYRVLEDITTQNDNTGVGEGVMTTLEGSSNTGIGNAVFNPLQTGDKNTGLGASVGGLGGTGGVQITSGDESTYIGYAASADNIASTGVLAIGAYAVANVATGATSGDDGPSIAIGSVERPVGFRGDASIYPAAGTSAGYLRVKLNGTFYKILLLADV